MKCILSSYSDIFFHLAAEEYLLKHQDEDIVMIWQSEKAVVVGKHQNTMNEINYSFIREKNIPVARRLSGGGTVYHGPGNLNFTFIMNGEKGKLVDFKRYVSLIREFLHEKGILADIGTKNDLLVNGLKISGNAEHVFKTRVLHHGTLLYNADLDILNETIKVVPGKYIDKAVQSNRSRVANVQSFMKHDLSVETFAQELFDFLLKKFNVAKSYSFDPAELEAITKLRNEKYSTWEWNFGYSPSFEMKREFNLGQDEEKGILVLHVVKGYVDYLEIIGNSRLQQLQNILKGCRYRYEDVKRKLNILNDKESSSILDLLF